MNLKQNHLLFNKRVYHSCINLVYDLFSLRS